MPLTTATVSGYLTKPDGTLLQGGRVVFTLSGMAASDNYIVNAQEVVVNTNSTGYFSVELMPNSAYEYPTSYTVTAYDRDALSGRTEGAYQFGKIRVPAGGGDIEDMLPVPVRRTTDVARVVQGDTLLWVAVYVDDVSKAINLTGATVECRFIHVGGSEQTATVDMTAASEGKLTIEADTTDWLNGFYSVRLSIEVGGVKKTQIGKLEVIK